MNDAPLLVIGGRTTGLMMAAELARHGAPVRIIDQSPGIDPHVRATLVHSRTLEIFQGLGLDSEVVELGQPMMRMLLYSNGKLTAEFSEDAVDSPFPQGIAFSQPRVEAILERHLNHLGVSVERSTRLLSLEQIGSVVRATLELPGGGQEIVETPWLIGCDGAHSTVRHLTEEVFPGEADPYPYLLADVHLEGPCKPGDTHIYLHDDGELFLFDIEQGRRLVVASGRRDSEAEESPTLEEMQRIAERRSCANFRLSDPRWLHRFHINYRLAPHYRHGRTFLAGDAAHIHSPIGALGMNTGIQDAYNLAWKLALVWRGVVPEAWLNSYETERRRVAEDVLALTREMTEKAEEYSGLTDAERKKLCEHMFVPDSKKPIARRHAEQLDLDYRASFLCFEPEGAFDSGPPAGSQAPDAVPLRVDGAECTLFDLLRDPRHRLFLFAGSDAAAEVAMEHARQVIDTHGHWIQAYVVSDHPPAAKPADGVKLVEDPGRKLHTRYGAESGGLYLIRPDGYIAYRSRKLGGLDDYLAATF